MNIFLQPEEAFLFNQGTFYHCYLKFGAHRSEVDKIWGVHFSLWAPHALRVSVVGNFNNWQGGTHEMEPQGETGVWSLFIPYLDVGEIYKYEIAGADGVIFLKSDPWAFYSERRPGTASIVYSLSGYLWGDDKWLQERGKHQGREKPLHIYEVHLGSWKRKEGGDFYGYRELAEELIPYTKEMGFTHIELLPLMEHPLDQSWGYQVTGYYSATSRYGTPHDLMYFIDRCHQAGLGVILDWVPGHFCKDAHGLGRFTGVPLFEGEEHEQWGTYKFDFTRTEVWSFLIGNAVYWFDRFHMDGLRVDGVTSMLLLNYGKGDKPWKPNVQGGKEDLDAIHFLRTLNTVIARYYPDALMIAEESTDWPMVTKPVEQGGLGFHYKWNMGWMNDTLKYGETDFSLRQERHGLLTFSLLYAFSEAFILPFSHDEVVHGKKSLVNKMPGDYWRKFAGLRLLFCYHISHPGKKLLFMGGEIAQFIEWRYDQGLDWLLLRYDMHRKFQEFVKTINHVYLREKSLWENDQDWAGFQWLEVDNKEQSILMFIRRPRKSGNFVLVLLNFQPTVYREYRVGVPFPGVYQEIFNTDEEKFGGSGQTNDAFIRAEGIPWHGMAYSIQMTVPPLAGVMMKRVRA